MIEPRFNLRDASARGATVINLILSYDNKRLKISTGISVPPKYWNTKNDRVKENKEFPDYSRINVDLEKYEKVLKDAFKFFEDREITPTTDVLKSKYLEFLTQPRKLNSSKTIWDYFDEFVEYQRGRIKARSVGDYDKALRKHLIATEEKFATPLSFNNLRSSGNFIEKMELYLTKYAINASGEQGFSLNAKGKQMKNIKSFLNWCFEKEYCPIFSIKHIVKCSEDVDNIYLSNEEIDSIYNLKIEDKLLCEVRDLFIVGCETGLRFSDFSRIKAEHINNSMITLYQTKVKSKVTIPVSMRLHDILQKYKYNLPQRADKGLTDFNKKLRELGELAKINESIVIQQTRGSETIEKFFRKYDLISSHTCRRSFCTNKFLKGVPINAIMAISGHKTEKSFRKYLKIGNDEIVKAFHDQLIAV